jgi:hypothetical protein
MLNPVTRICFGFAVLFTIWAASAWLRASRVSGDASMRTIQRAALPTGAALALIAAGLIAMMLFGPWARPYQPAPAFETARDKAADISE